MISVLPKLFTKDPVTVAILVLPGISPAWTGSPGDCVCLCYNQAFRDVLEKGFSENFEEIHRKVSFVKLVLEKNDFWELFRNIKAFAKLQVDATVVLSQGRAKNGFHKASQEVYTQIQIYLIMLKNFILQWICFNYDYELEIFVITYCFLNEFQSVGVFAPQIWWL